VDRVFVNVGKALAAFQRTLRLEPSRFDLFVRASLAGGRSDALTDAEKAGLRVFIGKGRCTQCHNGPLLTSGNFFSLAVPDAPDTFDPGRAAGIDLVRATPFNCQGQHADGRPSCDELRFMSLDKGGFLFAFKTPSLRNVARTAPYFHAGNAPTLEDVIRHYVKAPKPAPPAHTDILPLELTTAEQDQLVAFLHTLSSPVRSPLLAP
jgi:cytochrome c peroxidase